ncbi:hypothetical protein SMETH2_34390 [Serratia marcescens]|uniref:hypothetical protein n=1 Tax=Serratia ureilytica TaxID=300181 RepID=UPI0019CF55D2|nr:hypothetical protein [Serratia ureilytica]MBN5226934.1 hypothetical protein [Serratia ureilytica]BEN03308.1 hypothetical protein SMETH2_34390 [Serratia marcescens]
MRLNEVELFTVVETNTTYASQGSVGTLNLASILSVIETVGSYILFNLNDVVRIKLRCLHTTKNRRGKIVWYGEGEHFNFGFIVVGLEKNVVTDFYGEISSRGRCYFINPIKENTTSGCMSAEVIITETAQALSHDVLCECTGNVSQKSADKAAIHTGVVFSSTPGEPDPVKRTAHVAEVAHAKNVIKILAVYSRKTSDDIEKICLGKPYVKGRTTGSDMIACLAELTEDVTNIIFTNSRIDTKVEVILHEIHDPGNLIGIKDPLRVKHMLEGAYSAIEANDTSPRTLMNRNFFKLLSQLKQEKNAQIACVLLGEKGAESSLGVALSVPDSLKTLLTPRDELLDRCFISVLISGEGLPTSSLNRATFTHELGHVLGGEHPYIQLNNSKNEIKVNTDSKDFYWMKGYHLPNPQYSTIMGYKRRLPYFSASDVKLFGNNNHAIGESISGVTPVDMARGLRVTAKALAQGYKYAKPDIHLDIKVEPRLAGLPLPGVIEKDIVGDYQLKLTPVPFDGRSVFSHWVLNDVLVERQKETIIIDATKHQKVRAHFSSVAKVHDVTFDVREPVTDFMVFYELFDEALSLKSYSKKVKNSLFSETLKFPRGTDIELENMPNSSRENNSKLFLYTLDGTPVIAELPRFRITKDHVVGTCSVALGFHIERGDLGYIVYEQYTDDEPYYTVKLCGNSENTHWTVALNDIEVATSQNGNFNFLKRAFLPCLNADDVNKGGAATLKFDGPVHNITTRNIQLEYDVTVGKIMLYKEEIPDINDMIYAAYPAVTSMTVPQGTRMHAKIIFSEGAKKSGYKVKSWSHSHSTEDKITLQIEHDMVIKVSFTK